MNKIKLQIKKIKSEKRLGLMTHIVAGYPTLSESIKIIKSMEKVGADFVEIQIPFSDPMADGPTIMKANQVALDNGITVFDSFSLIKKISKHVTIPLIIMSYYNIVFNYGIEKFIKEAKKSGISGFIIPDLSFEEDEHEGFSKICEKSDLVNIRVLSPASTEERIEKNARLAHGMIYFMSRKGITGAQKEMNKELTKDLKRIKKITDIPIGVGIGISKPEHLKPLKEAKAQIAIIGSAVINEYNAKGVKGVESFLEKIVKNL
ncbi:MAG TPA: tryptophan synthase subunit alpha [Candidatus Dojkabacteria bacterium]